MKKRCIVWMILSIYSIYLIQNFSPNYTTVIQASSNMADGNYTVSISLLHATKNESSMGNDSLEPIGRLEVIDGKPFLYIKFRQMNLMGMDGYLMRMDLLENITLNANKYPIKYDLVPTTVIEYYDVIDEFNASTSTDINCAGKQYPWVIKVPVSFDETLYWTQVYVPVMGSIGFGEQLGRIEIDYSSMKMMTQEDEKNWNISKQEDSNNHSNENIENSEDPSTNNQSNNSEQNSNIDTNVTTNTTTQTTVTLRKSKLETQINKARKLLLQVDQYTDTSLQLLEEKLMVAELAYTNAHSQTILDANVEALKTAIQELVKKSTQVLNKNKLEDGKYNLYVYLWHATNNKESMGNQALNHKALLNVENGVYTLSISTKPMTLGSITACLHSLQIKQENGIFQYANVLASNNELEGEAVPSVFSFVLPNKKEYISIKIDPKVIIMGNEPLDARLKINWDTLEQVDGTTTIEENTTQVATSPNPSSSQQVNRNHEDVEEESSIVPQVLGMAEDIITPVETVVSNNEKTKENYWISWIITLISCIYSFGMMTIVIIIIVKKGWKNVV